MITLCTKIIDTGLDFLDLLETETGISFFHHTVQPENEQDLF